MAELGLGPALYTLKPMHLAVCSVPVSYCGKRLFSGVYLPEILEKRKEATGTVWHQRKTIGTVAGGPHFQAQLCIYLLPHE